MRLLAFHRFHFLSIGKLEMSEKQLAAAACERTEQACVCSARLFYFFLSKRALFTDTHHNLGYGNYCIKAHNCCGN